MKKSKFFSVLNSIDDCPENWTVFAFRKNSKYEQMNLQEFNDCALIFDIQDSLVEDFELVAVNTDEFLSIKQTIHELNLFRNVSYPTYDYGDKWTFVKPSGYFSIWALPIEWLSYARIDCTNDDSIFMNKIKPSTIFKGGRLDKGAVWTISRSKFIKNTFGILAKDSDGMINDYAMAPSFYTKCFGGLYLAKKGALRDFDLYQYPLKLVISSTNYFAQSSTFDWEYGKICEVSFDRKVDMRYNEE